MSATLGTATVAYLPIALFNIVDLVITFLFAIFGVKITHSKPEETSPAAQEETAWRDIGAQQVASTEYEFAGIRAKDIKIS